MGDELPADVLQQVQQHGPVGDGVQGGVQGQPLGLPAVAPLPAVQGLVGIGQQRGRRGDQIA